MAVRGLEKLPQWRQPSLAATQLQTSMRTCPAFVGADSWIIDFVFFELYPTMWALFGLDFIWTCLWPENSRD